MSKKEPSKLSGRAVADEKGNQRWVWDSKEGTIDTAVVRSLGEGLSLEGPAAPPKSEGSNPYDRQASNPYDRQASNPYDRRASTPNERRASNPHDRSNVTPVDKAPGKRRTLDDMRKLSEMIKRNKR